MQLKEKTWYKRRDGKIVYCIGKNVLQAEKDYWLAYYKATDSSSHYSHYFDNGRLSLLSESDVDLIEEVQPPDGSKPEKFALNKEIAFTLFLENIRASGFPKDEYILANLLDRTFAACKAFEERFG